MHIDSLVPGDVYSVGRTISGAGAVPFDWTVEPGQPDKIQDFKDLLTWGYTDETAPICISSEPPKLIIEGADPMIYNGDNLLLSCTPECFFGICHEGETTVCAATPASIVDVQLGSAAPAT